MVNLDDALVMMEFIEKVGISIEGMKSFYDEENSILSLEKQRYSLDERVMQNVTVKLEKEKNSLLIRNSICREYDIETIGDNPMTNYDIYRVHSVQELTKFKVDTDKLNIYTTTISQDIKEDTMGGGSWIIVDINTFSEFIDKDLRIFLPSYSIDVPIEKESYSVPSGYKITDGLSVVKKMEDSKIFNKAMK